MKEGIKIKGTKERKEERKRKKENEISTYK